MPSIAAESERAVNLESFSDQEPLRGESEPLFAVISNREPSVPKLVRRFGAFSKGLVFFVKQKPELCLVLQHSELKN
jgi:hypothetical protein